MPLSKFLDPKNDLAFKQIFGTERNQDILIHFLNDIFAGHTSPVEKVTFLKSIQEPEISSQRVSIVDILCQAINGDRFIVEMQVLHEPGFEKRAQFYAAKAYIEQRRKNLEYKDLKQVIFLAITDFTLFPKKTEYLSHHHMLDIQTYERDLKDFSFSFLELPKFTKTIHQLKTMTEKWAYFFKNAQETSDKDIRKIAGKDIIIERAYSELDRYSWTPEELRTYDSIDMKKFADKAIFEGARSDGKKEGLEEGKKAGLEEGKKVGLEEGIVVIARNLIRKKYGIDTIVDITGLTIKQVKTIQAEIGDNLL
jgi:predicted transposase/invertase (TIGR01784 family)